MVQPNFDPLAVAQPLQRLEGPLADSPVPPCPPGCLRAMTYNILTASPLKHPRPFARIFRALRPDVVLLQEWDGCDALELQEWFSREVSLSGTAGAAGTRWFVRQSAGRGVAVVSRFPLTRLGPYRLELAPPGAENSLPSPYFGPLVGYSGAIVHTRLGDFGAVAVHLTCCGSARSPEDQRRVAEARTINRTLRSQARVRPPMLVAAGDLNLVGTSEPLIELAANLDRNGQNLITAEPRVLGHQDSNTWRDDRLPYPPGRLDWLVYTGQTVEATQTFLLDTCRITDAALIASGLHRSDTAYSDHLPLVVDLRPR